MPSILALQLDDAVADQTAVHFELAFARTAEEAETAALSFQMGPRSDQPRALIGQRREFDLQPPLMGARSFTENFKDQAGTGR